MDLDVGNPNAPDARRALATPEAVEAHIAGAFRTWFNRHDSASAGGVYSYQGPVLALSAASFQHGSPWANAGMAYSSQIPRRAIENQAGDPNAPYLFEAWFASYRAISAIRDGLMQLDGRRVDLGEVGKLRARAFGRYVQGLAHGTIALLFDSGVVYDERIPLESARLQDYHAVMDAALRYLADAAARADSGTFTIPATWMSNETSSAELARLAHSWRARFRANLARTPAERAAVDWNAVEADVSAGITGDWSLLSDGSAFDDEAFLYGHYRGWAVMSPWVLGMADQSGKYQAWMDAPIWGKQPFLVVTGDTRFPQGATGSEQVANPGAYYAYTPPTRYSDPDHGTPWWLLSFYRNQYWDWWDAVRGRIPLVSAREMRLLLAEAAYRRGDLAEAAATVNETRTRYGLNATDAAGSNTSCVPKLPDGTCGGLWEMLKWEKRLETEWLGPLRAGWYFDGRGWGDLMSGTFLQVRVPYSDMLLLGGQPYSFGGVGGPWAAPAGTYSY